MTMNYLFKIYNSHFYIFDDKMYNFVIDRYTFTMNDRQICEFHQFNYIGFDNFLNDLKRHDLNSSIVFIQILHYFFDKS